MINMSRQRENTLTPPVTERHRELDPICGIRLEMIHFFADAEPNVQEVLSQVETPDSLDVFFRHLSAQAKQQLFLWQIRQVTPLSGRFSINLSLNMIAQPTFVQSLITQADPARIIIEIQDPGTMAHLGHSEQQHVLTSVRILRRAGFHVWLDDLYPQQLLTWQSSGMRFGAVKISSTLFHQFRSAQHQLASLIVRYRQVGRRVVIEGVETRQDYALSLESGADAVQGFLLRDTMPGGQAL